MVRQERIAEETMTEEQKKQAALAAVTKLEGLPYTLGFPLKWELSQDGRGPAMKYNRWLQQPHSLPLYPLPAPAHEGATA